MAEAVDAYLDDLRMQGRDGSARSYGTGLARVRRLDGSVRDLSPAVCRQLVADAARTLADSSVLTLYFQLRSLCTWCVERGYLPSNPTDGLPKPKQRPPRHRYLSAEQLRAMFSACRTDTDRLIMLLCGGSGLRSAEFLGLRWRDVDFERQTLRVLGKGKKWRELAPGARAFDVMASMPHEGYVAPFRERWTLLHHVRVLAKRAGVPYCTVHQLRHSFAVAFLEASGEDAFSLQTILGHASPAMTGYYLRSVREKAALRKQRAVDLTGRLFGD